MTVPTPCLGGCGRLLRTPESIARGYGPRCWAKRQPTTGKATPRRRSRPAYRPLRRPVRSLPDLSTWTGTPLPGQVAIPVQPSIPMEET